jgi:hypothetical protein
MIAAKIAARVGEEGLLGDNASIEVLFADGSGTRRFNASGEAQPATVQIDIQEQRRDSAKGKLK